MTETIAKIVPIPKVSVTWFDAWSNPDHNTRYSCEELQNVELEMRTSVGYLMSNNDKAVVLCTQYFPTQKFTKFSGLMVIPKVLVQKIEGDVNLKSLEG